MTDQDAMELDEARLLTRSQRSYLRSQGVSVPRLPHANEWTAERVDRLRVMIGWQWSATQCANDLGISRSAAMGKAYRMGLVVGGGRHGPMPAEDAEERKRQHNAKRRRTERGGRNPFKVPLPELGEAEPIPEGQIWQMLPGTVPLTILEAGMTSVAGRFRAPL